MQVGTDSEAMVLVIGATNRPQELDEVSLMLSRMETGNVPGVLSLLDSNDVYIFAQAARRRFVKRLYIPLPDENARQELICKLLKASCLLSCSYPAPSKPSNWFPLEFIDRHTVRRCIS